jgi:hypothetical protein
MVNKVNKQLFKVAFANAAKEHILRLITLDDTQNKEKYEFNIDGFYWDIYKTVFNDSLIEINVSSRNYKMLNDKPKRNRIYERCFVYITGTNKDCCTGKDAALCKSDGYIIDCLSFQNYIISIE